jgi:cytochrome P450
MDEVSKRRLEPGDDFVSYFLDVRVAEEPLSDEHIVNTLRLLLLAGITSTWSMIGASLWHLATHADDRILVTRFRGSPTMAMLRPTILNACRQ